MSFAETQEPFLVNAFVETGIFRVDREREWVSVGDGIRKFQSTSLLQRGSSVALDMMDDHLVLHGTCNEVQEVDEQEDIQDREPDKDVDAERWDGSALIVLADSREEHHGVHNGPDVDAKHQLLETITDQLIQDTIAQLRRGLIEHHHHHGKAENGQGEDAGCDGGDNGARCCSILQT